MPSLRTLWGRGIDRKVKEAEEEITKNGVLSDDKAIPLMLKTQFNHIAHLEESVTGEFGHIRLQFKEVDQRFKEMDQKFDQVNQKFEQVNQRFDQINNEMNGRFKEVDRKFDELAHEMNGRFKGIDQKFDQMGSEMERRFDSLGRNVLAGFALMMTAMTVFRFL